AIGVDRQPWTNRALPPALAGVTVAHRAHRMTVARPRMAEQDRVAVVVVERPPRLIRNGHVLQRHAAVECDGTGELEELAVADRIAGLPCAARRQWLARHLPPCPPRDRL